MKRVLLVAYYFPPIAASGAMRPLGFCRHLQSYNWQPSILTTTPQSVYPQHPVDQQLEAYVPSTVSVERVSYRDPLSYLIGLRNRLRMLRFNSPSEQDLMSKSDNGQGIRDKQLDSSRSTIKEAILDCLFAFPDRQASWTAPAVRRIASKEQESIPHVIVATGGPWSNFVVGNALARRFRRPLILDYRDPWTSNPYYSFTARFLTERARRLEASMCMSASRVLANTVELREKLCVDYPGISKKCVVIPNGYDEEILGMTDPPSASAVGEPATRGYELCHFGTVYGKRTPRVLFQAVSELWHEGELRAQHLRLRFIGAWESTDEECNTLALTLEKQGLLVREPPIPHALCLQQMRRASVLLVVQPDSPLQVPGKIYEYIAVGRPLLLVGGEGATANLVRRHQLGMSCANHSTELKRLLRDMLSGQTKLHPPDPQSTSQFNYRRLAESLAQTLDSVITEA